MHTVGHPHFEFYPTNKIVGIIDRAEDVSRLLVHLRDDRAATPSAEVLVLYGAEGEQFLDMLGVRHGLWGRLVRFMQGISLTDERMRVQGYVHALKTGRYVVAVQTDGRNISFPPVRQAFRQATGHNITFFGRAVIMPLPD